MKMTIWLKQISSLDVFKRKMGINKKLNIKKPQVPHYPKFKYFDDLFRKNRPGREIVDTPCTVLKVGSFLFNNLQISGFDSTFIYRKSFNLKKHDKGHKMQKISSR